MVHFLRVRKSPHTVRVTQCSLSEECARTVWIFENPAYIVCVGRACAYRRIKYVAYEMHVFLHVQKVIRHRNSTHVLHGVCAFRSM